MFACFSLEICVCFGDRDFRLEISYRLAPRNLPKFAEFRGPPPAAHLKAFAFLRTRAVRLLEICLEPRDARASFRQVFLALGADPQISANFGPAADARFYTNFQSKIAVIRFDSNYQSKIAKSLNLEIPIKFQKKIKENRPNQDFAKINENRQKKNIALGGFWNLETLVPRSGRFSWRWVRTRKFRDISGNFGAAADARNLTNYCIFSTVLRKYIDFQANIDILDLYTHFRSKT